jgi:ABC-type multidrug transport system fused ATPase/permease subunit
MQRLLIYPILLTGTPLLAAITDWHYETNYRPAHPSPLLQLPPTLSWNRDRHLLLHAADQFGRYRHPQFIRWIVDAGILPGNLSLIGWAVLGLLGITAVKGFLIYQQGIWTEISSQGVAYQLRNAIQQQLTIQSFAFHDQTEAGQILSRAMQDVERIRFLTGRAVLRLVEGVVQLLLTAVVLLWMNPTLAALVILTMPLLIHRAYAFGRQFRPLSIQIQDQLGVLTTRLEQNLRGAEIVKAFAQETPEIDHFTEQNEKWFGLAAESARIQAFNAPLLDLLANIGTVLILFVGGRMVINNSLTLGELVAFTTYLAQLVRPIRLMGRIIPILAIAASAGERIFAILDAPPQVGDLPDAKPLQVTNGRITFENVSFGYQDSHLILQNINFTAEPGEIIAILGATGAGKTTLINMLTRFYDPTHGRIRIDDQDIRHVTLASLRRQFGIVMQDTFLFGGSLRENISFGAPNASEEALIKAAKDAQAYEFIAKLTDGFDTRIGERGVTLSGGQKQRTAIARALLTDPRFLILDDATASVDTATEKKIQEALNRLMVDRTTFVIAHRLRTVLRADKILLMEKGRIVAAGNHETLLAESSLYKKIYQLQLAPQEEERRV